MWSKIISFLTAFPKSRLFQDQGLHIWGVGLWTFFFLVHTGNPWIVLPMGMILSALHEFWYDGQLPGAPSVGSLNSGGRLENFAGYVGGILLATALWGLPIVGIIGFWIVVALILGAGLIQMIKS